MQPLHDLSHGDAGRTAVHDADHDPAIRVPRRRLQAVTVLTGVVSAAVTAGMTALQGRPEFVRHQLEARTWGLEEITDERVAQAAVSPGAAALAVLAVLAVAAVVVLGAARGWGSTRWAGVLAALVGLLTAVYWSVDAGALVGHGGGLGVAVFVGTVVMAVLCAAWLLVAFRRDTRDAYDG